MKAKAAKSKSYLLAKVCVLALEEKKAGDLKVLDVSEQSSITNFLVLATATSEPHLRALRVEIEKTLDAEKTHIVGTETAEESGWTVIDAFDVMIHLFTPERRKVYGLDKLWKDAVNIPVSEFLPGAEPKAPKKAKIAAPKKVKATAKVAKEPAKKAAKAKKVTKKR
jgi:ribosome-associated protein